MTGRTNGPYSLIHVYLFSEKAFYIEYGFLILDIL